MTALLTPPEASELLAVSVNTLRHWRNHRTGPAYVKVGRTVRYRNEDLEQWIARQMVRPRRAS